MSYWEPQLRISSLAGSFPFLLPSQLLRLMVLRCWVVCHTQANICRVICKMAHLLQPHVAYGKHTPLPHYWWMCPFFSCHSSLQPHLTQGPFPGGVKYHPCVPPNLKITRSRSPIISFETYLTDFKMKESLQLILWNQYYPDIKTRQRYNKKTTDQYFLSTQIQIF